MIQYRMPQPIEGLAGTVRLIRIHKRNQFDVETTFLRDVLVTCFFFFINHIIYIY